MKLPAAFLDRMQALLGDELEPFLNSYEDERFYGLRVNTLKISVEAFLRITPFTLTPIPWTKDGFYYDPEDKPTKHPHYYAGLYYIQEPSAMAPVNVLEPKETDNVLDMCACPGGKSVQIASYLKNKGLLVSNDVSTGRIKALVKNLEMMGVTNILILNTTEDVIGEKLEGFFDKVLIDAPCSGEGMFRKEPKMVASWGTHDTDHCRELQDSILKHIGSVLKPEGELVYSTCTFSRLENEDCLQDFMASRTDYAQSKIEANQFEFATESGYGRLWPHKLKGEGHFVAKLRRIEGETPAYKELKFNEAPDYFKDFMKETLKAPLEGHFEEMNGKLYLRPKYDLPLKGVRVVRYGWLLGEWNGKKFTPSQALAMGLKLTDAKNSISFSGDQIEAIKYLKGETLHVEGAEGMTLVGVDGYPLGWAKMNKGMLKNMYQSTWRLL
jgi:NOL1/NOP2/sun family putative RNA methylase